MSAEFRARPFAVLILSCALAATVLVIDEWWAPGDWSATSFIVVAAILSIWGAALVDARLGAGVFLSALTLAAILSPPAFNLWGDGALRLRSLGREIPALEAAPLEPGEYAVHQALLSSGMSPAATYGVTGLAGGALYVAGVLMIARRALTRSGSASILAMAATPTAMVFFTGYVESYALLAGAVSLFAALAAAGSRARWCIVCAVAASVVHMAGAAMIPGAALAALGEGRRRTALATLVLAPVLPLSLMLLAGMSAASIPTPAVADPRGKLLLAAFSTPALILLLPAPGRHSRAPVLLTSILYAALFCFFPLERGAAIDWDLGAVLLLPVFLGVLTSVSKLQARVLAPAVIASALAAGPRIGSFLDTPSSEDRYRQVLEDSRDPAAFEELGVMERDRGRFVEAAALFERAFELSGNGRHLAQLSEAARMSGRPDVALLAARRAAAARPDVETVWLQYALAARDAGSPEDASEAARRHEAAFPGASPLWSYALETALARGDTTLAIEAATRVLSYAPDDPVALVNAAWAAQMSGDPELAMELLRRAAQAAPGDPLPHYDMGVVALGSGDTVSARTHLESALALDPGMDAAMEMLRVLREHP